VLKRLSIAGKRFEVWAEVEAAIAAGTQYWNKHRKPYKWECGGDTSDIYGWWSGLVGWSRC